MELAPIFKYILMIVVVAMLGLNIFAYLARGTEIASDTLRNLVHLAERITGALFKTSIAGTKTGISIAEKSVDELDRIVDGGLARNIGVAAGYGADYPQTRGKRGFCFIGEDNGTRNCIQVGNNDTCMSGKIFPSMDLCINPNLRGS